MNKKIWILSELYYPEETSTGYILTKIAENLAQNYTVSVITGPPGYTSFYTNLPLSETHNGVFIERCNAPRLNKNRLLFRVIKTLALSFLLFKKTLMKVHRGDLIIVVTNPPSLMVLVAIICFVRKTKFCILVHDVFPENLVIANLLKRNSFLFRTLKILSAWVYKRSYKIIVIGRDMEKLIKNIINPPANQVQLITNWADNDVINPLQRKNNLLIAKLNLQDKFILQFAGNLGRVQGLEFIIETARVLRSENIHFLLIGDGAMKSVIEKNIRRHKLKNISLIGNQPRQLQTEFLNACDVALISLAPGMLGMGVPSKTYNIMAAGKPIIAAVDAQSEIGLVVEEEGIGWVVRPGDTDQLTQIILKAKANPSCLKIMGDKARSLAESKYSFLHIAKDYNDLIEEAFDQS